MSTTASDAKSILFHRIESMSNADVLMVLEFVDTMNAHEPNEETLEAIQDAIEGKNLSKLYDDVDEMMKDLLEGNGV